MVADWRAVAVTNRRKTSFAIASFIAVYLVLGALIALMAFPRPYAMNQVLSVLQVRQSQIIMLGFLVFSLIAVVIAIWFGGRFSLSGTKSTLIDMDTSNPLYLKLYNVVEEMKIAGGMRSMPKVYVIDAAYMNAFAAGWNEQRAIVAITQPLLEALNREELQAVMAHELSHIKHRDTQVMTVVAVLSSLSIWIIDSIFRSVIYGGGRHQRKSERGGGFLVILIVALRVVLPIITAFLVMYVSRSREMLADSGCVQLTRNPEALAHALIKIHQHHVSEASQMKDAYGHTAHNSLRSLAYMYDPNAVSRIDRWDMNAWFATHPSLSKRLKALGAEHLIKTT